MKKWPQNKSPWRASRASALAGLVLAGFCLTGALSLAASSVSSAPSDIPLSWPIGRGIQRILGITTLARVAGESILEKQLHKKAQGYIVVNLTPYSASDLLKGKVKRLEVKGRNLLVDKAFHISQLDIITDEDTPVWIELRHGNLYKPVEADVRIVLTEADMAQTFASPKLQKKLARIKAPVFGGSAKRLSLSQPVVQFSPECLQMAGTLAFEGTAPSDAIPLVIQSRLRVDEATQKPVFSDIHVESTSKTLDASQLTPLMEEALHWVSDPDKLIPMDKAKLRIRKIQLTDDSLTLEGHVWLKASAKLSQ